MSRREAVKETVNEKAVVRNQPGCGSICGEVVIDDQARSAALSTLANHTHYPSPPPPPHPHLPPPGNVKWKLGDDSGEAALKSFAVKSVNVRGRRNNPCVSWKQSSAASARPRGWQSGQVPHRPLIHADVHRAMWRVVSSGRGCFFNLPRQVQTC